MMKVSHDGRDEEKRILVKGKPNFPFNSNQAALKFPKINNASSSSLNFIKEKLLIFFLMAMMKFFPFFPSLSMEISFSYSNKSLCLLSPLLFYFKWTLFWAA